MKYLLIALLILSAGCTPKQKEYMVKDYVIVKTIQSVPLGDGDMLLRYGQLQLHPGNRIIVLSTVVQDDSPDAAQDPEPKTMAHK